jgi:cell division septum initiation protein DivIVA
MRPRNVSVVGQGDHDPLPDEGVVRVEANRSPYEDLGERVAGVLAAADEAAARIQGEAETEAERVRHAADEYANDVQAAVAAYAKEQRREAEEQAEATVAAANAEARALREAAQAMADRLEEEARRGTLKLREDTRALEERRRQALDDLREIAAALQDLVDGETAARPESIANARARRRSR